MRTQPNLQRTLFSNVAALGAVSAAAAMLAPAEAWARGNGSCVLKGTYPISRGVSIFDSPNGGKVIATFSGGSVPVTLSSIPIDPQTSRARIATTAGESGLRITGYVPASLIGVFTAKDVPVAGSAVAIASGYRVRLVGATSSSLTVEHTVAGAGGQTVKASASCEHFTLDKVAPTTISVAGDSMRAYGTKASTIDIFDTADATANPVFTMKLGADLTHIFWSSDKSGDFVKVKSRADLAIDGWAKISALTLLPKRVPEDQIVPSVGATVSSQISLESQPEVIRASRRAEVRLRRDDKEPAIGFIDPGAEVYVAQKIGAWVNVLPKHLGVLPPDGSGFWVRRKHL